MKQRLRILVPSILILVAAVFFFRQELGKPGATSPDTIAGNGVIEATEVNLSAKIAGRILVLQAREGDDVAAGALVAVLESDELQGGVEQSTGNLKAAEAAYAALAAGTRAEEIRRARAQYDAALDAVKQAEARLSLIKAGAREELIKQLQGGYEQAKAHLSLVKAGPREEEIAQLRAALRQAESQLSLVKEGPRKEQIEQLRAALAQAQAKLAEAERELKRYQQMYAQGGVSGQQVDLMKTQRDVAQAAVDAAEQRLAEARAGARPQELQAAEAAVEVARQRLTAAQNGARPEERQAAEAAVETAYQRLQEAKNGPRPQEREQAEAQVAMARAQASAARAALDLAINGPRKEDLAAASARVEQARGAVTTAAATNRQTKIYAPAGGRITLRNVEPGELVTPGLPIVRIAQLDTVWIRVYVPAPHIGRIKTGQRAEVTTDAFPQRRFAGQVIEIAQQPEFTPKNVQTKEERVKLVYGIKIEVANPDGDLKPGMPGDAVIHTAE